MKKLLLALLICCSGTLLGQTYDVTSMVTNPNFDGDAHGWTVAISRYNNAGYQSATHWGDGLSVSQFIEAWISSSSGCLGSGEIYQQLTNMPEGTYTLEAEAVGTQTDSYASTNGVTFFLADEVTPADYTVPVLTYGDAPQHFSVSGVCKGGTLRIGIRVAEGSTSNWIALDNVKLYLQSETFVSDATEVNFTHAISGLALGSTEQFQATTNSTYPYFQTVTWQSSNPSVASIDQNGLVTALSAGTTKIRATACGLENIYKEVTVTVSKNHPENLVINEVQVANIDQYIDHSYNYGGWVEFYNPSSSAISLSGLYLSKHLDNPTQFLILNSIGNIPSKGFLTVWFDHNASEGYYGGEAEKQVNFKLDCDGDTLFLFDADGNLVLSQVYPEAVPRCSWARITDGGEEWGITSTPTPDASNIGSKFATERLSAPLVSQDGCLFTSPFSFQVEIPSGATLRYTTDGSTPTSTHGETSSNGTFQVEGTTVYRFCLIEEGYLPSPVVTRSFIYKNHAYYLPVLSIVTNPDNLYDDTIGVYTQGTNGRTGNGRSDACNWNMDWERPVNMEYMEPVNTEGEISFLTRLNQETTFEICGGWSRAYGGGTVDGKYWPMKSSFRLKSDEVYEGVNSMDYSIFPNKPYNKYRVWQVRNGGNDTYARVTDFALNQISLQSKFYLDAQDGQQAHVFFNGQYLGMLNIRESNNRHYGYSNYGIDTDDMDQFDLSGSKYNQKVGDDVAWEQLVSLAQQLSWDQSKSTYQQVCELLDIDEYCNYMAYECYLGCSDWITNTNNVKGFRCRSDQGKFHFVLFDSDSAFGTSSMTSQLVNGDYGADVDDLFRYLMQYEPFRQQFITAFCIVNGSVLDPDRCQTIIQEIFDHTNTALGFEGNSSNTSLANTIRNAHDGDRMTKLQNLYTLDDPYQLTLSSNIGAGRILINGQEVPNAQLSGKVFPPINLTTKAPVGYKFQGWQLMDGSSMLCDTIIAFESDWEYYDQGSLDGQDWTSLDYDTSNWSSGEAPLGYASASKSMYSLIHTTMDYGSDASNKRPTYYFRHRFYLDEAPQEDDTYLLYYKVDDGFCFYLNGKGIDGYRVTPGAEYSYVTGVYTGDEPDTGTLSISGSDLQQGWNMLALEVHNTSVTSSDICWDGELVRTYSIDVPVNHISESETFSLSDAISAGEYELKAMYTPVTSDRERLEIGASPIRINEVSAGNDIYIDENFKKRDWLELYNTTDADIDLAGMYLSDNTQNARKYCISAGDSQTSTIIPAHGHRIVWCDGKQPTSELHASFKLDNADGASVGIMAEDGTWEDRMEYLAQDRWQTFGRYPDGGVYESIFLQPTIDRANLLGTFDFEAGGSEIWQDSEMAITLELVKGWNWTSHNLSQAVSAGRFTSNATTILGEKGSELTTLDAAQGYKLDMQDATDVTLRGELYDVAQPVSLHQGWNWVGVPLYNPTTIQSALQNYTPSEGDMIVGLESFALYSEGQWHGALTSLSPGQAYLMKVGVAQDFCWNALSQARSGKRRYAAPRLEEAVPWRFDLHTYPNVMNMVASLEINGEPVKNEDYTLGVFSGDECRGVAEVVDGLLYLNIHGTACESLSFRLLTPEGETLLANESVTFLKQTLMGSQQSPYSITVGKPDEILSLSPSGKVVSVQYFSLSGQRLSAPSERVCLQKTTYENGKTVTKKLIK